MTTPWLTVIILTKDEEKNLPLCLQSLKNLGPVIWIVDSGSQDGTLDLAERNGCYIASHPWTTHADQLNWALTSLPITTPWVMRLDADERLTIELATELGAKLPILAGDVNGILIKRRVYFWGRWIRHGGYYPTWLLRIWRNGKARCEQRSMDEHMTVDCGRIICFEYDIIDENHKGLTFWTEKHNGYADLEVKDLLDIFDRQSASDLVGQAQRRRWAKERFYAKSPLFFRPFAYWMYRYVFRLGFLDGVPGLVFHFLQGFWYRFLVDAKLYELILVTRTAQADQLTARDNRNPPL